MNKKELARLLFQRKDIRALFESRRFDASTLKRVISEEIMRESEESGFTDVETVQARENAAEMEELQVSLDLAQDNFKAFQSDYLRAKERFTQAKTDGDSSAQSNAKRAMAQAKTFRKNEQERIDKIVAQIAYLKSLGVTASKTQTPDDDKYVNMAVNTVAQNIKNATDMIDAAENEAELAGISRDVATSNSGELETAQKAVQAAVAKDKESPPPSESSEEETTPQPPAEDPNDTQDAGRPWGDARKAARAKVTAETRPEDIEKALSSPKEFIEFFNPRGDKVGTKMRQIEELFNGEFFQKEIEKIRAKAQEASGATEAEKSEKTQIVIDDAADLMGTYVAFDQYLEQLPDDYEIQAVSDAVRDFLPTSTPKSADEFDQDFLGPIDDEITGGEGVDTDSNFDFSQKREQLIKRAESTLPYLGIEDTAILDNKPFMIFMGTVLEKEGLISEQEETAQSYVDRYISEIENEETRKEYFLKPEEAGELVQFLNTNKEQVDGIIAKAIKGSTEDPNAAAKDVIENTPEVEPDADADLGPLATEEMDAAWTTTLDVFFGKSREKSSFMRQFLLKNQASMLYGMIGVLEQITTGGAGGEERAYTGEKTQVKQKEEPVTPPAEADKKETPPKTDTTSTDAPADEEENVVGESLEEQVINEIFGMFGGKDKEDKEIKFSPKSTKLMRQDLEAMVDLLRSLKTDIGQYKKYSTSSSVDPRFDGSTLKRAMDAKLKVVQQSIAHLTKVIDIEVQSQKDQLKADGAQAGHDSVDLQEASGSDRKVRIAEVEKVYNEMRRQYLKGLKVSLSTNDAEEAKAGAKELKDYVMGQKTFMSYFPSNIITSSGGVMTLGAAHESMVAIIAPFIETIRDIVTITKTQKVSESNLQQAIGNLVMISDAIESMFKVPSLIDREFMKKYIEAAKQNPENQPLTDEEPEMMDRMKDLAGKGLEKLKQMFSWMSEETGKLLLKFFGGESELIDGLSNSDLSDDEKQEIVEEIAADIPWIQKYSSPTQGMAIAQFSKNLMDIAMQKQIFNEEVEIPTKFKDQMRAIAGTVDLLDDATIEADMVEAIEMIEEGDRQQAILKIMEEDPDGLSTHVSLMYKLGPDLGGEFVKELIADPVGGMPEPESLPDADGDDELASADTIDQTLDAADALRSRSDLEDKPEAEEEKDDTTGITALKAPITNQWVQFGNVWLKLSDKASTIIPDLAGELALEFIEEGAESLSPKPSPEVEQDLEEVLGFSMKEKVAKTISEVEKELKSTKNERFSGNSPWAFYSGPSSEAGADAEYKGVRGKRSKSIAINTSMSILNANKDKIEKMLKVSKKKDIIELLKQMVLTKGVPALLGGSGIDFQNNLLSNPFMKQYKDSIDFQEFSDSLETGHADELDTEENRQPEDLEEALRPIIEKMLNEHYNY